VRESRYWVMFLASGVLIFLMLGVHMGVMHLESVLGLLGIHLGDPLEYDTVVSRGTSTAWLVLYILLLVIGLYHGLYGLRSVLLEVFHTERANRWISGLVILIGVIAFSWGAYVTVYTFTIGGL